MGILGFLDAIKNFFFGDGDLGDDDGVELYREEEDDDDDEGVYYWGDTMDIHGYGADNVMEMLDYIVDEPVGEEVLNNWDWESAVNYVTDAPIGILHIYIDDGGQIHVYRTDSDKVSQ
jgi:hypothetical protein